MKAFGLSAIWHVKYKCSFRVFQFLWTCILFCCWHLKEHWKFICPLVTRRYFNQKWFLSHWLGYGLLTLCCHFFPSICGEWFIMTHLNTNVTWTTIWTSDKCIFLQQYLLESQLSWFAYVSLWSSSVSSAFVTRWHRKGQWFWKLTTTHPVIPTRPDCVNNNWNSKTLERKRRNRS